jgi:AraC family transcriptional regulator
MAGRTTAPQVRVLARGEGWSVAEYLCAAGPQDRPFEERHGSVTIAAVLAGSFQYRTDTGRALLCPGAFVLGNAGASFECGHAHGTGDRCIALALAPARFAEIAASEAGDLRWSFPTAMLPSRAGILPQVAAVEALAASAEADRIEQALPLLFASVVRTLASGTPGLPPLGARDQLRVSRALRHIEAHAREPLDLQAMAQAAGTSRYHFLRIFARAVGTTPHQWLLGLRLRRAALRLATTARPVSEIAFESGFGDLSTFHQRFRRAFGRTPAQHRALR